MLGTPDEEDDQMGDGDGVDGEGMVYGTWQLTADLGSEEVAAAADGGQLVVAEPVAGADIVDSPQSVAVDPSWLPLSQQPALCRSLPRR